MKVPRWCTHPAVYLGAFVATAVVFYAVYPVVLLIEKAAAARRRGHE